MSRTAVVLSLLALTVAPLLARAEDPEIAAVAALQKAVKRAIKSAESSVACVLVSRSKDYAQYPAYAPATDNSGRLGSFDASKVALPQRPRHFGNRELAAVERRAIEALDLSLPDTVPESFGSGVVIDASGLILTNAHVVRDATKIFVRLSGNRGSWADIHALDPRSDLAVLKLIDPVPDLKAIKIGDGDKVEVGDFVVSLANPYAAGFRDGNPTASLGMIGNLKRRAPGNPNELERSKQTIHEYGTLLQTDVRLALGSSGGALLNLDGELIGLTTATAALSGSETPGGYALPMDAGLKRVIEVLKRGEEVEYGFLGVQMDLNPPRGSKGVVIADIPFGLPAANAGMQRGDVILAVDGKPVKDNDDLFVLIGLALAGNTAKVEVLRNGEAVTVKAQLAKFAVPGSVIASKRPLAPGGLRVDYRSILLQRTLGPFGQRVPPDGVAIREDPPANSPARKAELQKDYVITHVEGQKVSTPKEFYAEMAKHAGREVKLTVVGFDGQSFPAKILDKE